MSKLEKYTQSLRSYRRLHRYIGLSIALLLLISAITGILLSLKKDIALIQPPTQKGIEKDLNKWQSMDQIAQIAQSRLYKDYPDQQGNPIDRIDIRPSKGIAKVIFEKGYWEVQVDGSTGAVRSVAKRHSDWIEALHDGSIIGDWFKLLSMNLLGIGVIFMISTGFWLWYGPRLLRKLKWNRGEK